MSTITVDKHTIELSNEHKILFPKSKITKGELINYYVRIAPIMLPHILKHPITMQRFPDGITHEGFYQKDIGNYFPTWIKRITIKSTLDAHSVTYAVCDNAATLAYLANQAVITIHLWLSTVGKLHHPDRLVFDLDPSNTVSWQTLIDGTQQLNKILTAYGLSPFVMTTGSKGLHVVVPLAQKNTFTHVRSFAITIAQQLVTDNPKLFTMEITKEKRKNKIFIDTLRNQWAQLAVAPYAIRAIEGGPIAAPLSWDELEHIKSAQQYTINNIHTRIKKYGDPWAPFSSHAHTLPKLKK